MKIIKKCQLKFAPELKNAPLNEENYEILIEPYERAGKTIENRLRQMDWKYQKVEERSPFHSIEIRMKTLPSILGKLERKGLNNTCVNVCNRIGDIAGIRVICYYIAEVYVIVEQIKHMKNIIVLKEKDYIENPRGSGYRSYHLVIGAKIPGEEDEAYLPVEIQIRTIGMDWWASMEHQLCYKPVEGQEEALNSEMKKYSKQLYSIEKQMQKFYTPAEPAMNRGEHK